MNVPELETQRLKLIELNENHAAQLFEVFSDEEAMKYWDDLPQKNVEETKELIAFLRKRIKEGTGICWGMMLKEAPQDVIGLVTYNAYKKDRNGYIGYIIARKHWGKGLMTEALKISVEYGFTDLGVHRIEAHVEPGNIASEKVLEKIGFQREGLLRQRVYQKGSYQDTIYYGLLKTDQRNTKQ